MKRSTPLLHFGLSGIFVLFVAFASSLTSGAANHPPSIQDTILEIRLTVEPAALQRLAENPQEFVRAEFQAQGQTYPVVGVKLRPQVQEVVTESKPSFLIRLDAFEPGKSLSGIREFIVEQSVFDSSLLARYCAARLATAMDVPCPVHSHATVALNGRHLGLYALVETVNAEFVARVSGNGKGFLAEAQIMESLAGRGGPMRIPLPEDYAGSLSNALGQAGSSFMSEIDRVLASDRLVRFVAWETFIRNTSGYSHSGSNAWLLVRSDTQRGELVPGALFRTFIAPKTTILGGRESVIGRRLWESPDGRRRFLETLLLVATNSVLERQLIADLELRASLLSAHLASSTEMRGFNDQVSYLEKTIAERFEQVRKETTQLSLLSDTQLAGVKLPRVITSDFARPQTLASVGRDYTDQFDRMLTASSVTSSMPVKVHEVVITAPPGLLENMPWDATNWLSVSVSIDGTKFEQVGFRLKGHGSRQGFRGKPSFTLKLNAQRKDQAFAGNTKFHFQNATYNASLLNEYLASWVFRRARLPSPRTGFAHLRVNGIDYGVSVVVEGSTRSMLQREFGNDEGILYEGEYSDVDGALDLDSGAVPPAFDGLARLTEGANEAIRSGTMGSLTNILNLPQFAGFIAGEIAVGHSDGYALAANNYRLYLPPDHGRFQFIPHGLDHLVMDRKRAMPEARGILARALFTTREGREAYAAALEQLLNQTVDMRQLVTDLAVATRELQLVLKQNDALQAPAQLGGARALVNRFGSRRAYLLEQLPVEKERPIPDPLSRRLRAQITRQTSADH